MQTQTIPVAFSGDIPAFYDAYLGPMFFEPFALELAHRLGQSGPLQVLELAAGTGRLTRMLPSVLPAAAKITATDINPAMVRFGKNMQGDNSTQWAEVDAVTLPFDDVRFDCVAVAFGVMFYSDRRQAFKEAYRVLKPGGTFLFTCWDEIEKNPMAQMAQETLRHFFPVDTPAFYTVPFSYHDENQIAGDLRAAGFDHIKIETKALTGYSQSAANAAKGLIHGTPTITAIEERNPDILPDLMVYLENKIAERFSAHLLQVPIQAHVVTVIK